MKNQNDLSGITINGMTLDAHLNREKRNEIDIFKNETVDSIAHSIYHSPVLDAPRIDRRKENRNSRTKIYSKKEVMIMNHEKNLPEIIKGDYSQAQKIFAILLTGDKYTVEKTREVLNKHGDSRGNNSISACYAWLMKSDISRLIIRNQEFRNYEYSLVPVAFEIDFRTINRLLSKRDPYTFKDLCQDRPELKERIEALKKEKIPKKIDRIEQQETIIQSEPITEKQPERINHVFDFNFNINIKFGR